MYQGHQQKIVSTIEARMGSTRLPGKVLLPLAGKPALERLIERLKRSRYLDQIVVATTTEKKDDPIAELTEKLKVRCFRGSEKDVLKRVLEAAQSVKADIIVEITGDCPLMDSRLVDRGIEEFFNHKADYAANIIERSYPIGFDVQVFPVSILAQVDKLTQDLVDRVHVSCYIYNHPDKFRLHNWSSEKEYHWPDLRLTLDEKADYKLIDIIFKELLPGNENFGVREILQFLKRNPHLLEINKNVKAKQIREG